MGKIRKCHEKSAGKIRKYHEKTAEKKTQGALDVLFHKKALNEHLWQSRRSS